MKFASPLAFLLLIPLILVVVFYIWQRRKKEATLQYSSLLSLKDIHLTWRAKLIFLPYYLKVASLVFVIIALARPQTTDTKVKKNVEGIDIMIVLDVSDSMLIEDMKPNNRIGSAKETIAKFVQSRSSDRIGLIIFAGEAFTLVPLTMDYELLLSRIAEIKTAQEARIKDGTAIGVAVANGANRLKESTARSRVMIFATDGENNSGTIDPETGLEIAKGYGIKIYSIGIGRDGPTKIPIYQKDVFGNSVKSYQPFESTVNENLLSRMASETNGKYFRASREDSLGGVFKEIDRLEKTKIDINKYTRYKEEFGRFLWFATFLYLLAWFLSSTWLRRTP